MNAHIGGMGEVVWARGVLGLVLLGLQKGMIRLFSNCEIISN